MQWLAIASVWFCTSLETDGAWANEDEHKKALDAENAKKKGKNGKFRKICFCG